MTVTVLNGSGTAGAATRGTDSLKQAGFRTGIPDSTRTTTSTIVEYPAGMESQAKAVAARVPGAAASVSASVRDVTLVLGTDGKKVGPDTSKATSLPSASRQAHARTAPHTSCIN